MYTNSTENIYRITKRLKTPEEVEEYFPGFKSFIDSTTEQQQQKYPDLSIIKERGCSIWERRKETYYKDTDYG